MRVVLELSKVWKIYRPSEEVSVEALRGIDLKIREGELMAIMGPSGSGKSTLLHIIGCLDKPTRGKVFLNGRDTSRMSDDELARARGKTIGFVFQAYNLIPSLNIVQNVELPMIFQGVGKDDRRRRAVSLLERLGLGNRLSHRPNQLSGGQQQRVAIARALANDPKIILADEPTGNLDSKSGGEVLKLLMELNDEGKTIVIVTHDPEIARKVERVVKIRDGRIVSDKGSN